MSTLKNFVERVFHGCSESQFSRTDIIEFIRKSEQLDSDVYDRIILVDYDDLMLFINTFDDDSIRSNMNEYQRALIFNAKLEIRIICREIEYDKADKLDWLNDNGVENKSIKIDLMP